MLSVIISFGLEYMGNFYPFLPVFPRTSVRHKHYFCFLFPEKRGVLSEKQGWGGLPIRTLEVNPKGRILGKCPRRKPGKLSASHQQEEPTGRDKTGPNSKNQTKSQGRGGEGQNGSSRALPRESRPRVRTGRASSVCRFEGDDLHSSRIIGKRNCGERREGSSWGRREPLGVRKDGLGRVASCSWQLGVRQLWFSSAPRWPQDCC